jgi:mannose-6-phosphate isomerase-like protein (cupin superfamily)
MSETKDRPAPEAISIGDAIGALPGPWQPRDLVRANDAIVRVARLEGEFPWHEHDEDELFLCWDGAFRIELEGSPAVAMGPGSIFVVPRGTRHRPVAERRAHALVLERPETKQYGNR